MPNSTINWNQAQQLEKEQKEREAQRKLEFQETLNEAREEVQDLIQSGDPFTYSDIEEILLGYGLEMDYVEYML